MAVGLSRRIINIDLFTDAYRVTGQTDIGVGGVQSELSNPSSDFLEISQAYISRIHQPGEIIASYSRCGFRKSNINFIILHDRREGLPIGTQHGLSVYMRGRPIRVFLSVPSFEIEGTVQHEGQISPSAILVKSPGSFQPIFKARASASLYPEITYSADLILAQKDRIAICAINTTAVK